MLMTLGAVALLAASPQAPVKVAVPSFTVVGVDAALGEAWAERFVTLLGRDSDITLITARDIQQVLGLERQKQLLGCGEGNASCLAELAGALGVDAILSGTFAKSETSITATLRILKAADGSQLAAATGRLKDAEALQDWLEVQAGELGARLRVAFKLEVKAAPAPAPKASSGGGFPVARLVPGIVGVALVGGGIGCFAASKGSADALRTQRGLDAMTISSTAGTGRVLEGLGLGLMIAGGVAIAASAVWMVAAPRGEVGVAFVPGDGGGTFAVGGVW